MSSRSVISQSRLVTCYTFSIHLPCLAFQNAIGRFVCLREWRKLENTKRNTNDKKRDAQISDGDTNYLLYTSKPYLASCSRKMRQSLSNVINFRLCVDARETGLSLRSIHNRYLVRCCRLITHTAQLTGRHSQTCRRVCVDQWVFISVAANTHTKRRPASSSRLDWVGKIERTWRSLAFLAFNWPSQAEYEGSRFRFCDGFRHNYTSGMFWAPERAFHKICISSERLWQDIITHFLLLPHGPQRK
jgi:hypothetical protein